MIKIVTLESNKLLFFFKSKTEFFLSQKNINNLRNFMVACDETQLIKNPNKIDKNIE